MSNWKLEIHDYRAHHAQWITPADIARCRREPGTLELAPSVIESAAASRELLVRTERDGKAVYGVTTGFGAQGGMVIPPEQRVALQGAVIEYHGAGVGPVLSEGDSRAAFLCRIVSLAQGRSAVRPQLLQHMVAVFNAGISPVIPSRGSVGASGDLTPLSYLAAMLNGRREAWVSGRRQSAAAALREAGIQAWEWDIKEGLALINGTAVMTAIAAAACDDVRRLAQWSDTITGLAAAATGSPEEPFAEWVHDCKHHPGSITAAAAIRDAGLSRQPVSESPVRDNIQPRYSIRCAPQVNGVLHDTLDLAEQWLLREINSSNDNPLFDAPGARVYHTGHFYGGHVAAASDYLRIALSTTGHLLDRQVQLLLEGSGSLPANLAAVDDGEPRFGLKALGITSSALAAELQHTAAPVAVLTRSTESQNQDIVSMGSISAMKLRESVELGYLLAAHGLAVAGQAAEIARPQAVQQPLLQWLRRYVPLVTHNQALGSELDILAMHMAAKY